MKGAVTCPGCQRRLKVATDKTGARLLCPKCSTRFVLGSPSGEQGGGPVQFLAFELFDESPMDDIQVIEAGSAGDDDIEVIGPAKPTVRPVNKGIMGTAPSTENNAEPPKEAPRKRRKTEVDPADFFAEDYDEENDPLTILTGGPNFDSPEKRRKLTLVYWGLTLVLLSIFLFVGALGLAFMGFLTMLSSGIEEGIGLLGIGMIVALATDSCRIVGYGLCIAMPGRSSAKSWAFIALALSLGSVCLQTFQFFAAMIEPNFLPFIIIIVSFLLAIMSWISFLLFLETVADVIGERGIADSVSATIKAGGTFCLCFVVGMASQFGLVIYSASHGKPNFMEGADPSVIMFDCCHGAFSAFTAILGIVVAIRYVMALLNVRRLIEAWL
ncbi:MAG TPA: hypothetical protein VKS79_16605 [Gemmataceae bacterium]|nr:hypothetical protein [Gemmataceae bacterium]